MKDGMVQKNEYTIPERKIGIQLKSEDSSKQTLLTVIYNSTNNYY
jgi:hypothetical protein